MDAILDIVMMMSLHQIGPLTSVKGIHFCNFLPIFIIIARLEVTKKLKFVRPTPYLDGFWMGLGAQISKC